MLRAIETIQPYLTSGDLSMVPEEVKDADSLTALPQEYAVLAMIGVCSLQGALEDPIDLANKKDIRYLEQLNNTVTEYANARTDSLTGLKNRKGLAEWLEVNYRENTRTYGIVAIDLSEFKRLNDALGHDAGDRAISQAADFFKQYVRFANNSGKKYGHKHEQTDVIARTGGDEFFIVIDLDGVSTEVASSTVKRVVIALEGTTLSVVGRSGESASHGIRVGAVLSTPQNPITYKDAMLLADDLMNAKRTENDR